MFELSIDISQLDTFASRLAGFDVRLRRALVKAITRSRLVVEAEAKKLLTGPVLQRRTGTLYRSITGRTEQLPDRVRGIIGSNVPYARIHELGGRTRPHEIRPKNAKALHFYMGGGWDHSGYGGMTEVFARVVHHPGSRIPERSYLRRALREQAERIRAEIRAAVREAAAFGGGSVEI
jgi:phage gpG-like protein